MSIEPFIPSGRNLKTFLLGAVWVSAGGLGPAAYEVWDGLTNYDQMDWGHVVRSIGLGCGPMLVAYWRKHRALISEPPEGGKDD